MRKVLMILTLLFALSTNNSTAQQDWINSLNAFNLYDNNGAFAGSYKEISLAARYRAQWTGLEGAPNSQYISAHMPIFQNVGTGIRLFNESIGARRRTIVKGTISYRLPLKKGSLGFAFNAGLANQRFDIDKLISKNDLTNILTVDNQAASSLQMDFSSLWYSNLHYAGFEVVNVNEPSFFPGDFVAMKQKRQFNFMGGYALKINENIVFRPTAAIRYIPGIAPSAEMNLSLFFNQKIWFGAGYRMDYGATFLSEWNISDNFRLGYSYDFGLGPVTNLSASSHEFFLGYRINREDTQGTSIRYFK